MVLNCPNNKDTCYYFLGYRRQNIPGYPTYQIKGVDNVEYNLFISTTKLADDDEYQCQVGPFGDNKELRGVGHLIVQGLCVLSSIS